MALLDRIHQLPARQSVNVSALQTHMLDGDTQHANIVQKTLKHFSQFHGPHFILFHDQVLLTS